MSLPDDWYKAPCDSGAKHSKDARVEWCVSTINTNIDADSAVSLATEEVERFATAQIVDSAPYNFGRQVQMVSPSEPHFADACALVLTWMRGLTGTFPAGAEIDAVGQMWCGGIGQGVVTHVLRPVYVSALNGGAS